jgi:hypothetical protein
LPDSCTAFPAARTAIACHRPKNGEVRTGLSFSRTQALNSVPDCNSRTGPNPTRPARASDWVDTFGPEGGRRPPFFLCWGAAGRRHSDQCGSTQRRALRRRSGVKKSGPPRFPGSQFILCCACARPRRRAASHSRCLAARPSRTGGSLRGRRPQPPVLRCFRTRAPERRRRSG